MQFNRLSATAASGENSWQPTGGDDWIKASGSNYKIERKVNFDTNKIIVADTITNITQQDIGLKIVYRIITPQVQTATRLAGNDISVSRESGMADNPSLFVPQQDTALGMLADDNLFRLQTAAAKIDNYSELYTVNFGLAAGKSYTIERSIYPIKGTGYFDFINQVRTERNYNHTLQGPFVFNVPQPGFKVGISFVFPWFDDLSTSEKLRAEYVVKVGKNRDILRSQQPQAKQLGGIQINAGVVDTRLLKDGDKIRTSAKTGQGTYGLVMTADETKILESHPLADSSLRDKNGNFIMDTYYCANPYIYFQVQPENDNARFREIIKTIDYFIDELKFDGIYFDQFEPGCGNGLQIADRCRFDKWDGHTVDLNEDGSIKRKYYDLALTGATARGKIIEHALKKGKIVVANTHPNVKETNALNSFRFAEMTNDRLSDFIFTQEMPPVLRYQSKGHLSSSPLTLGVITSYVAKPEEKRDALAINRAIITALTNGQLYYHYSNVIPEGTGGQGISEYMFPFTPVELHAGYLIGKERILTCITRKFQVKTANAPTVKIFDRLGMPKDGGCTIIRSKNVYDVEIKLHDYNETAAIIFN